MDTWSRQSQNWREPLPTRVGIASAPCRPLIKRWSRSKKASSFFSRTGDDSSVTLRSSGDAHFRVRTVYLTQRFADFAYGGVRAHRVNDVGHCVRGRDVAAGFGPRILCRDFL